MLSSRAVLIHVAAGNHRKEGRKGGARATFAVHIACTGQNFRYTRSALRSHLLDPCSNNGVVDARRNAHPGMKKRRSSGGAGVLDASTGDPHKAKSGADIRCKVILSNKRRTGKISKVKGFHIPRSECGVS